MFFGSTLAVAGDVNLGAKRTEGNLDASSTDAR